MFDAQQEFRTSDGVDIQLFDVDQYYVGWTIPGEYMRYSVDVVEAGGCG